MKLPILASLVLLIGVLVGQSIYIFQCNTYRKEVKHYRANADDFKIMIGLKILEALERDELRELR